MSDKLAGKLPDALRREAEALRRFWADESGTSLHLAAADQFEQAADRIEALEQRVKLLEEALEKIAADASVSLAGDKAIYQGWRKIAVERIDIARAALSA